MKNTLKYTGIVIGLLLIGFTIGFLINGRITHQKLQNFKSMNTEQGFFHEFRRIVKPTPEQMEILEPILQKYADSNQDRMMEFRDQQRQLFLDMRTEIEPILTEEQIKRLESVQNRMSRKHHDKRKRNNKRRDR